MALIDPRAAVLAAGGDLPSIEDLFTRPDWQLDAACRYADPALFFPESGVNATKARRICARCPVIDACAEFAAGTIRSHDDRAGGEGGIALFGIWAGMNPKERRAARPLDGAA